MIYMHWASEILKPLVSARNLKGGSAGKCLRLMSEQLWLRNNMALVSASQKTLSWISCLCKRLRLSFKDQALKLKALFCVFELFLSCHSMTRNKQTKQSSILLTHWLWVFLWVIPTSGTITVCTKRFSLILYKKMALRYFLLLWLSSPPWLFPPVCYPLLCVYVYVVCFTLFCAGSSCSVSWKTMPRSLPWKVLYYFDTSSGLFFVRTIFVIS